MTPSVSRKCSTAELNARVNLICMSRYEVETGIEPVYTVLQTVA